jgi:hypothetical protein
VRPQKFAKNRGLVVFLPNFDSQILCIRDFLQLDPRSLLDLSCLLLPQAVFFEQNPTVEGLSPRWLGKEYTGIYGQALGAVAQMVNGIKNSSTERKRRDFYPENKDGSRLLMGYLVNQTIGQHVL